MLATLRDWLVFTALRIMNALGWPTWLLVLIAIVVVPPVAVYSYFYWVKKALEASE